MLYQTRVVHKQAIQWTGENLHALKDFAGDNLNFIADVGLIINTLEGSMKASIDDYIIRGLEGEFYACKPTVFEKSYEPIARGLTI